jgi:hypothetical protein
LDKIRWILLEGVKKYTYNMAEMHKVCLENPAQGAGCKPKAGRALASKNASGYRWPEITVIPMQRGTEWNTGLFCEGIWQVEQFQIKYPSLSRYAEWLAKTLWLTGDDPDRSEHGAGVQDYGEEILAGKRVLS